MTEHIDMARTMVCGVDEVGRGPLVGAVVTAAVILDPEHPIPLLNDSKKLTDKKRRMLAEQIKMHAYCWALGRAEVAEIDQLNILNATMLAMQRAVAALPNKPELVLVDGNRTPDFGCPSRAIVGGDGSQPAISAASIIAKVARDDEMLALETQYPGYGFAKHKGYPTALHLQQLAALGPTPEHRRSFKPVRRVIEQQQTNE